MTGLRDRTFRLRRIAAASGHRAIVLAFVCATVPSLFAIAGPIPTSSETLSRNDAPATATAPMQAIARTHNGSLRLAVAANFRKPLDELAVEFERSQGIGLSATYGSSGLLAAQIRQGAPFDVFLSGDTSRPDALIGDGLAVPPVTIYARGRVVLRTTGSPAATRQTRPRRIGIPNPNLAPYGAAAIQCLDRLGVRGQIQQRLVFGNNVNQVDHFLESGALHLGFVALSQLVARNVPREEYWVCPTAYHAPIAQGAVILRRSSKISAARTLLRFMIRPATQARLEHLGYPSGD